MLTAIASQTNKTLRWLTVALGAVTISLTASAAPLCQDLFRLNLRAVSQPSLLEGTFTIVAMKDKSTSVGQLTYKLLANDTRLEIVGVKVEDSALRQGVAEFLIKAALERNSDVEEVEAEYVQTNEEVIRNEMARGLPLEDAVLTAPTSRTLIKFGFSKRLAVHDADGLIYVRLARP